MEEKKTPFTLLPGSKIAGAPSGGAAASNVKYFDKYRLDVDSIRVEAESRIRELANNSIRQAVQPPSPNELVDIVPSRHRLAAGLKTPSLEALRNFYNQELRQKNEEWSTILSTLDRKWSKTQQILTDELKRKLNRHHHPIVVGGAMQQRINANQLLNNPSLLDNYTFQDVVRLRDMIEDELTGEYGALSRYKEDVDLFVSEWKPYLVKRNEYKAMNDVKVKAIRDTEKRDIEELSRQHEIAKRYVASLLPQVNKTVEVKCEYKGYNHDGPFELKIDDTVREFTQKYLQSHELPPDRSAQAFIDGGCALRPTVKLSKYNLHDVSHINIVFGIGGGAAPP